MILRPLLRGPVAVPAAALVLTLSACGDSSAPAVPAQVTVTAGDQQVVPVGEGAPIPLSVRVTTQGGGAVGGEEVVWRVASGSAQVDPDTSSTDASGIATTTVRVGESAGEVTVTATVRDLPPATFVLQAAAGAATSVAVVAGNNQVGVVGETLAEPVTVEARDRYGNPVSGATIEFSTSTGDLSPASVTTNAQGRASASWSLPTTPGGHSALARLAGSSAGATLQATATAGPPSTLEKVSGDAQQAPPGSALPQALVVRVLDAFGNPVPGVAVSFATPDGGTFSPAQPNTGQQGLAQTTWTLGSDQALVDQTATATVPGVGSVTFTAVARDPCTEASILEVGATASGRLEPGDCQPFGDGTFADFFIVPAAEQGFYRFEMASGTLDSFLIGADAATGRTLAANDDGGEGVDARIDLFAPPGDYLLVANTLLPQAGDYTLSAELMPPDAPGCRNPWLMDGVVTTLTLAADDCTFSGIDANFDQFTIALAAGDTIVVTMTSSEVDARLELWAAGPQRIAFDESSAGGTDARLTYAVPSGAAFAAYNVVATSSAQGQFGSYMLEVQVASPPGVRTSSPLPLPRKIAPAPPLK